MGVAVLAVLAASAMAFTSFTGHPALGLPTLTGTAQTTAPSPMGTAPTSPAGQALADWYGLSGWTPLTTPDAGSPADTTTLSAREARLLAREKRQRDAFEATYGPAAQVSSSTISQVLPGCAPSALGDPGTPLTALLADAVDGNTGLIDGAPAVFPDYDPPQVFGAHDLAQGYCAGVGFALDHGMHADLTRTPGARAANPQALAWTQEPGPGARFSTITDSFTSAMAETWRAWFAEPTEVLAGTGWGTGYENVRALTGIDTMVALRDGSTLRVVDPSVVAPLTQVEVAVDEVRMDRDPAPSSGGLGQPRLIVTFALTADLSMTRDRDGDPAPSRSTGSRGDLWAVPYAKTYTLVLVDSSQGWRVDAASAALRTLDVNKASPINVPDLPDVPAPRS